MRTRYGDIHEVWFDGAHGAGTNGKRQVYDGPRIWGAVRRMQPDAVIFSDAGPDVRWIGNARGVAGVTNWSTVRPEIVPVPGMEGGAGCPGSFGHESQRTPLLIGGAQRELARDIGGWRTVLEGTTIGHRRLEHVIRGRPRALRLTIEDALEAPLPVRVACDATAPMD